MTDHNREEREALIEKAAKAIYFRADEIGLNLNVGPIQAEALARAVLAVFEQAHAPVDDERIVRALDYIENGTMPSERREWLRTLAAGFRRTVQGEPTEADLTQQFDAVRDSNRDWMRWTPFDIAWSFWRAALRAAAAAREEGQGR